MAEHIHVAIIARKPADLPDTTISDDNGERSIEIKRVPMDYFASTILKETFYDAQALLIEQNQMDPTLRTEMFISFFPDLSQIVIHDFDTFLEIASHHNFPVKPSEALQTIVEAELPFAIAAIFFFRSTRMTKELAETYGEIKSIAGSLWDHQILGMNIQYP